MQFHQNISANVISAKSNSANCGRVGKKAISAKCAVQKKAMRLFLPKLSLHEKILAFKGQEGQERSCNFLFQNFWELRLVQI